MEGDTVTGTDAQEPIGVRCGGRFVSYPSCSMARCARPARCTSSASDAGDRVAILLRNSIEFLEASIATVPLGASAVPINWHWRGEEIAHVLRDSAAKALIVHADLWPASPRSLPATRRRRDRRRPAGLRDARSRNGSLAGRTGAPVRRRARSAGASCSSVASPGSSRPRARP